MYGHSTANPTPQHRLVELEVGPALVTHIRVTGQIPEGWHDSPKPNLLTSSTQTPTATSGCWFSRQCRRCSYMLHGGDRSAIFNANRSRYANHNSNNCRKQGGKAKRNINLAVSIAWTERSNGTRVFSAPFEYVSSLRVSNLNLKLSLVNLIHFTVACRFPKHLDGLNPHVCKSSTSQLDPQLATTAALSVWDATLTFLGLRHTSQLPAQTRGVIISSKCASNDCRLHPPHTPLLLSLATITHRCCRRCHIDIIIDVPQYFNMTCGLYNPRHTTAVRLTGLRN